MARSKPSRVRADSLKVHPDAQRKLVPSKIKKLSGTLDLDAIGTLHIVDYKIGRQAGPWIIDGQHRWSVLMQHGFGEWMVDVLLHLDVTDDQRASDLFLKLNDRAVVGPFDKFRNEVASGNPTALYVKKIVEKHGLEITPAYGDGHITCVSALKNAYARDAGVALDLTLQTLIEAHGHTASAVEGKLVDGLALVYAVHNGAVDTAALTKKLAKYPGGASGLLGDAKGLREFRRGSMGRCVAEVIVETYNRGRSEAKRLAKL